MRQCLFWLRGHPTAGGDGSRTPVGLAVKVVRAVQKGVMVGRGVRQSLVGCDGLSLLSLRRHHSWAGAVLPLIGLGAVERLGLRRQSSVRGAPVRDAVHARYRLVVERDVAVG